MLRCAKPDDLEKISALLIAANLPTEGIEKQLDSFVVFEAAGSVVGTGGLEFRLPFALLRSLVVAHSYQGRGLASTICDHLESEAADRGVSCLYLLTETAEQFFSRRGYAASSRGNAPPEIATTEEFSALCPESAVLMRRPA